MKNTEALFPNVENKKNYPAPIFIDSNGLLLNGRLSVSIKLSADLKKYVRNEQLGITVIKRKQPSQYGSTHFAVVNQDEWPNNEEINRNLLTIGYGNENAVSFTLTMEQLKSLAYKSKTSKMTYAKIEIVDNGMQIGIFRYYKQAPREVAVFKAAQKFTLPAQPVAIENPIKEAQETLDDFFIN